MNKIYNSKLFTILKFYNADFTRGVAEWTPAVTPWGCFHYRFSSQYSTNQLLSQP